MWTSCSDGTTSSNWISNQLPSRYGKQVASFYLPRRVDSTSLSLPARCGRSRYGAQETRADGVHHYQRGLVRTYKGSVAGQPGAQARFTIDKNTFEGLVITPGQIYFIEPAKRYSAAAATGDFIVYKQTRSSAEFIWRMRIEWQKRSATKRSAFKTRLACLSRTPRWMNSFRLRAL